MRSKMECCRRRRGGRVGGRGGRAAGGGEECRTSEARGEEAEVDAGLKKRGCEDESKSSRVNRLSDLRVGVEEARRD